MKSTKHTNVNTETSFRNKNLSNKANNIALSQTKV